MKEAIQLISKRLQDPVATISDGTLLAVAHLAEFEVLMISLLIWMLANYLDN